MRRLLWGIVCLLACAGVASAQIVTQPHGGGSTTNFTGKGAVTVDSLTTSGAAGTHKLNVENGASGHPNSPNAGDGDTLYGLPYWYSTVGSSWVSGMMGGENTITYSSSITVNWASASTQDVTMTGSPTITFSNATAGEVYRLAACQDSTGSRTITWGSTIRWAGGAAPTLTTTASKCDVITCAYVNSTLGYFCDADKNF
jgi:hypothetical protein